MSPVRYSLHYEDYSEQLMSRFGKLLQQQALVDMTLMCSTHTLRVHKAVLAASSAYFEDVLQKVSGEPLVVLKISFSVLKSLVEFMYCGRTACGHDSLSELLAAARFLGIKGLSRVTREGLGITQHEEIPEFSAPVVINRPAVPAARVPSHSLSTHQECGEPQPSTSQANGVSDRSTKTDAEKCLPMHCVTRRPDAVVRVPLEVGGAAAARGYAAEQARAARPRRGRPTVRRGGAAATAVAAGGGGGGGGPWERRGGGGGVMARAAERALQRRERDSRHAIQRLSTLQNSRMQDYMEQVSLSQAVDSICGPEQAPSFLGGDFTFPEPPPAASGLGSAMSQYVDALKSAGLPTDLPIVFETGDGSYVNVDEQVLMDMVQSSEIQYEVVERPIGLEAAAQPGQVKSIDDLSRCIEQGAMRSFPQDDGGGLSAILPDSAEPYSLPEPPPRAARANPFDGDPFGGGALADDVRSYYEEHFNAALLPADPGDPRRPDCFDFELQGAFKGDALDCLVSDAPPPADAAPAAADYDDRFGGMLKFHERPPPPPDVEVGCEAPPPAGCEDEREAPPPQEPAAPPACEPAPAAGDGGTPESSAAIRQAEAPPNRAADATDAASEIEKLIDQMKSERSPVCCKEAAGVEAETEAAEDEAEVEEAAHGRHKRRAPASPAPAARCLRSKVKKKL